MFVDDLPHALAVLKPVQNTEEERKATAGEKERNNPATWEISTAGYKHQSDRRETGILSDAAKKQNSPADMLLYEF